jgi:ATP-dependent DNA helicase RecQ
VDGDSCRRAALLEHFGDSALPSPLGSCCDACDPGLLEGLAPEPARLAAEVGDLDDAIISVVQSARPSVGRTTCAEILHGARTKKIERNSYDGLPAYATSAGMRRADILARIDELIGEQKLETTKGPYPVLQLPSAA